MLGVQQEAPVKKRRHKGLWVTATAACLCCGMLFGVNAAFPAFAESLPLVGGFFESFNGEELLYCSFPKNCPRSLFGHL